MDCSGLFDVGADVTCEALHFATFIHWAKGECVDHFIERGPSECKCASPPIPPPLRINNILVIYP